MKELVGRSIKAARIDGDFIRFETAEGTTISYEAEGDCCSSSWFESIDNDDALIDARVITVEDVDLDKVVDRSEYECLQLYGTKITTTKGSATIDMRNSSNGYYGGSIEYRGEA